MRRREDSFTLGRVLWRLGRRPPRSLLAAPERPIGAKLEITYACNLRCGFCYTDSPRHTLQRTPEMSDEQWREVVRQSLELGIVEAVVTGGEPFLRERADPGADRDPGGRAGRRHPQHQRLVRRRGGGKPAGALSGVTAHVSLDGARAGLHDGSRGVPGSWRRAIEGIDRLLGAGIGVCVVHVVTPGNADGVADFFEQMWALGVPWVRATPVVMTGAAARGGEWSISDKALEQVAESFRQKHGEAMRVQVQPGTGGGVTLQGRAAPGSFLVRPNGDVRPDSLRPFTFGNAVQDGVESCWAAIREGWDDERINRWADSLKKPGDLPKSDLVAYLDDELSVVDLTGTNNNQGAGGRNAPVPEATPTKPVDPVEELKEAEAKVRDLAGARRYKHAPLRWTGSPEQRFVRLAGDGSYLRLNESGGVVMDALDGGTLADAASALRARYDIDEARARDDAETTTRELLRRGVVMAAEGIGSFPAEPGTTDLPGSEPNG